LPNDSFRQLDFCYYGADTLPAVLVDDGQIKDENLQENNLNKAWLFEQLIQMLFGHKY
jgi:uncharacterized membrane protein YcaP (DUF421 family)